MIASSAVDACPQVRGDQRRASRSQSPRRSRAQLTRARRRCHARHLLPLVAQRVLTAAFRLAARARQTRAPSRSTRGLARRRPAATLKRRARSGRRTGATCTINSGWRTSHATASRTIGSPSASGTTHGSVWSEDLRGAALLSPYPTARIANHEAVRINGTSGPQAAPLRMAETSGPLDLLAFSRSWTSNVCTHVL